MCFCIRFIFVTDYFYNEAFQIYSIPYRATILKVRLMLVSNLKFSSLRAILSNVELCHKYKTCFLTNIFSSSGLLKLSLCLKCHRRMFTMQAVANWQIPHKSMFFTPSVWYLPSALCSHSHLSSVIVTSSSGGLNCSSRSLFNADSSNFSGSSGSGALDGSTFSVFFSSSSSSSFRLTPPPSLVTSSSSSFLVSSVLLSSPSCLALVSVSERQWINS